MPIPSRSRLTALLLALPVLLSAPAAAQSVAEENGAIVYTPPSGSPRRLAEGPGDCDPALSPDGRWVVFVRREGSGCDSGAETGAPRLYSIGVDGDGLRLLLTGTTGDAEPEASLAGLASPRFSPDGRTVYFLTRAWATSGAVHALEVETGEHRFVAPANSLGVVPSGEYAGHLVVSQHRYFVGGGSYDWYWLLAPDGREVGPIGESLDGFRETCGGG